MLAAYLGITDNKWFEYLQWNQITDEVNFWIPSAPAHKHVEPGTLWLLKLHSPQDFIAGVGVFMRYSVLPLQMAWDAFGKANGVPALDAFRAAIMRHKNPGADVWNTDVGCAILSEVVYLPRGLWLPYRTDSLVSGKHMTSAEDQLVVQQVLHSVELAPSNPPGVHDQPFYNDSYTPQYALSEVRKGQGAFRVAVTDAYHRQCAVTGEHSLPCWRPRTSCPGPTPTPMTSPTASCCAPTSTSCSMPAMSPSTPTATALWSASA